MKPASRNQWHLPAKLKRLAINVEGLLASNKQCSIAWQCGEMKYLGELYRGKWQSEKKPSSGYHNRLTSGQETPCAGRSA